jgi:MFS family permease
LLLVFFVVLLIAFIIVEIAMPKTATIPSHIIKNRSVLAAVWYVFMAGAGLIVLVYFIPIWFQAIKGVSPVKSGIMNIPLVLGLVVASLAAGFLTKKIGYYAPWMLLGAIIMPIGAGLISTFTVHTGHSKWIGYQVLYGFGMGLGMQQGSVAVQTVLQRRDVATGASLIFFFQGMGGALFSSIGNNIFDNKLKQGLQNIPGLNAEIITNIGATNLRQVVSPQQLPSVLIAYNAALMQAFYVAAGVAAMAIIGAAAVEWKSIKTGGEQGTTGSKPAEAVGEK